MFQFLLMAGLLTNLFNSKLGLILNTKVPPQPPAKIICLDPGHGGEDSGAVYNDLTEAQANLQISQRLKKLLEQNRYQVIMTRSDNATELENSQRAQVCNESHANILLSIHLNAGDDPTLDYTQGLYGDETKDKVLTQTLHNSLVSSLKIADYDMDSLEDNALIKAQMPATLQETVFLSSDDEYKKLTDGTGTRQQQIAQALYQGIINYFNSQKLTTK